MELKGWLLFKMKSLVEAAAGTRERVRLLGIGESRDGHVAGAESWWGSRWAGQGAGRRIREGVCGPRGDTDRSLGNSAVRGVSVLAVVLVTPPPTHTHVCVDFMFETAFPALILYPP